MPHRTDSDAVVNVYLRFVRLLELKDGFRHNNPETKAYTHVSTHGTLSRIDRIPVSPKLMKNCHNWGISDVAGGLTDHRMVSVTISAPGAPFIGKGRWSAPLFLYHDKEFIDLAMDEACKLEDSMLEPRTELCSAQTKFEGFKDSTIVHAQKRAKTAVGASEKKKKALVDERETLLNGPPVEPTTEVAIDPDPAINNENPSVQSEHHQMMGEKSQEEVAKLVAVIEKKIDELVGRQRERTRLDTKVRGYTELNHITKYTVNLSKDKKPRDTLTYLRCTDIVPERGSRRSSEMAGIARDYHNDLQSDGIGVDLEEREAARKIALDLLPQPGEGADMKPLAEKLTEADVLEALLDSAAGKAAGMNGFATEFWRRLEAIHRENKKDEENGAPKRRTCDIIKVLTWVFNDIEEHGMVEESKFSLGWMCPLFKKKDRTDIANYRPITVLNSDYKIFTKALSNKLSSCLPDPQRPIRLHEGKEDNRCYLPSNGSC
jgi:hypothetical protein